MKSTRHIENGFMPILIGFIAGFLATLTFHQITLWILHGVGIAPFGPFNMTPTKPFAIPVVISLALWGGLWGILLAWGRHRLPGGKMYWLSTFLFGAILPSLVALLIVAPLKGHPLGGGWPPMLLLTVFLINGAWGIGTAIFINLLSKIPGYHHAQAESCPSGTVCR